jgi:hypothetical protein
LLTLENVEAIHDGRQPVEMTLALLMQSFPASWGEQSSTVAPIKESAFNHLPTASHPAS